ncbi:ParM/StbA family protein [Gottfriedia acidiceleris]|uniref:ParM/StbA family protein n=1 Tax=Gottfriedia acidiceleris TaxID=371036 RepID=A0ABY4JF16_9BACI|nr:ParM/StbA family protein [Gottfriedia acidiceleris]UPM52438.1 ParM/StbA family protein [Gottfriedia acidiceleris]
MVNNYELAAIDIGNALVKGIFNSIENCLQIPNVICEELENRNIKEFEKSTLNGIHVQVKSNALQIREGIFSIGNLAAKNEFSNSMSSNTRKTQNDQSIILLLTALAINAAESFKNNSNSNVVNVSYLLSTGVPMNELKNKQELINKLENNLHEVTFLQTPFLEGIKVCIKLEKVFVNLEGLASYIHLSMNNSSLGNKAIGIFDIGGLTTDIAVIEKNQVNNLESRGYDIGISPFLDEIIKEIKMKYNYKITSRDELTNILIHQNGMIKVLGTQVSINKLCEFPFMKIASKQVEILKEIWHDVPSMDEVYFVGGGASIINGYIKEVLNKQEMDLPISFLEPRESIWALVMSYFSILQEYEKLRHGEIK